ncbi:MAG: hypothetical protein WAW02_07195 [Sideroxyarcus sp.]
MELDSKEVLQVLKNKKVTNFVHVDTVRTACSYLRQGKLLSRGTLGELGLPQTEQHTDQLDKRHGLWYDVFVDTVDIHYRARMRNNYGPVLFEFALDVLEQDWLPYVWITRSNPSGWNQNITFEEKYFQSINEFSDNFEFGNFDKLFVLRNAGGVIRLNNYLQRIALDPTNRSIAGVRAYDQAVGALKASAIAGGVANLQIVTHPCRTGCNCQTQYENMTEAVFEKFFNP